MVYLFFDIKIIAYKLILEQIIFFYLFITLINIIIVVKNVISINIMVKLLKLPFSIGNVNTVKYNIKHESVNEGIKTKNKKNLKVKFLEIFPSG